ncbi:MAG: hypothetical protein VX745_08230 [Pseudomonadota bacterium]|nr:hypothetical protein [Pseudomonadota bacterium]
MKVAGVKYVVLILAAGNIVFWFYHQRGDNGVDTSTVHVPALLEKSAPRSVVLDGEVSEERWLIDRGVVNTVVTPSIKEVPECLRLGPFKGPVEARGGQSLLEALDVKVSLSAVDRPTGIEDYRVLIPPMKTSQQAFRRKRELQSRDIDGYVITEGVNANGISLGVFPTQAAAQNARNSLETRGYHTVIIPMPRYHREYWLKPIDAPSIGAEVLYRIRVEESAVSVSLTECEP